jgi:hypothetical protein
MIASPIPVAVLGRGSERRGAALAMMMATATSRSIPMSSEARASYRS